MLPHGSVLRVVQFKIRSMCFDLLSFSKVDRMSLMVKGSVSILFLMGLALGLDEGESTRNRISTTVTKSTVAETNSGTLQPSF